MKDICILIRVYNRIEDLVYCVDIIRDTWHSAQYYVLVVFNGEGDGYRIPDITKKKIDELRVISNNTGHFSGNSTLLLEGLPYVPSDCEYMIILEADTWLYGDRLIVKYINEMKKKNAVWASAQFFRYVRNLATDFAIIDAAFAKSHPNVFTFQETPEYYVANYLHGLGKLFIYITELMPVNLPKYIRKYPFAPTGRFFVFPKGKMVTHHIESLAGGMEEKKFYFNLAANKKYFNVTDLKSLKITRWLFKLAVALTILIPYKSWFIKTKDA